MKENAGDGATPHVVIVGGGFGGLEAAKRLSKAPVRVTLIDRNNHHLFQPLLYQVATAGLSPADIAEPIRAILSRARNVDVMLGEVTGVDADRHLVMVGEDAIPYDYLILATGARHSYFGHPDWERHARGLKTISDATAIRRSILMGFESAEMEPDPEVRRALLTFVVVGAGPTGVEMAGAIAELSRTVLARDFRHIDPASARVVLVEAGPRVLPAFPPELSASAECALGRLGVEVRLGAAVSSVDAQGVRIGNERLESRTVIWAAGVRASAVGEWLGADTDSDGRVRVSGDLTVSGQPNVFVIGDTAHVEQDGRLLRGVAQVAIQQGRSAAETIAERIAGRSRTKPFRYHDKGSLATIGRSAAVAVRGRIRLSGFVAWVAWLAVHIYFLIGFQRRLLVLIQWAWAYLTFRRGARLIVMDQTGWRTIPADTGDNEGACERMRKGG